MLTEQTVYTVSQLNLQARLLLESHFSLITVTGEISNLARPASGHLYFTLKDAQAQIRCALFRNRLAGDPGQFENGTQILARAKVSLYEGRGDYQLIVEYAEEIGSGALARQFDALKKTLGARGWFDAARKRPLPDLVRTIGIVTSSTGAAIIDILSTLQRRFSGITVIIYPCEVQGKQSAQSIAKQIHTASRRHECDALIVSRGGGSLEDLWGFNEEIVAQAILDCSIPVISAVGHEIDVTIADFVADIRAATPTAAAELVSPDQRTLMAHITTLAQRLQYLIGHRLVRSQTALAAISARLKHPGQAILERMQRVDELEMRLHRAMKMTLSDNTTQFQHAVGLLESLNPLAVLKRGYTMTYVDAHVVTSAGMIKSQDTVRIHFHDGDVSAVVK